MFEVLQFPCLKDNYGLLVRDSASGEVAAVDTPEAAPILAAAERAGWRLTQVWNTHWHADHAGGNAAIKEALDVEIVGPAEVERIGRAPDRVVKDGDIVELGALKARVMHVGGHTAGHVAYVLDEQKTVFVGDTLFSLGCGRVFEGTYEDMWKSISKIAALPDDFTLYCAHEYTQKNANFALTVDPDNTVLQARAEEIRRLREQGTPTLPVTIGAEKAANPFLRAPLLKAALGMPNASDVEAFAEVRRRKDKF